MDNKGFDRGLEVICMEKMLHLPAPTVLTLRGTKLGLLRYAGTFNYAFNKNTKSRLHRAQAFFRIENPSSRSRVKCV